MDVVPNVDPAEGSAVPEPSAPNIVVIRCHCPKDRHDFDTVTLAPDVDIALGAAALAVLRGATDRHVATGDLLSVYLQFGVIDWTLTDDKGKPEPLTRENILRRLTFAKGGYEVGEVADTLYSPVVGPPFRAEREKSLRNGQQAPSTSPTNGSGSKRPTRSTRSSQPKTAAGSPSADPAG